MTNHTNTTTTTIRKLSDIRKEQQAFFGLPRESRISIKDLYNQEIIFYEHLISNIRGQEKVLIKFAYLTNPSVYHYFITKSEVIRDKIQKDSSILPFIATIKKIKEYTMYE